MGWMEVSALDVPVPVQSLTKQMAIPHRRPHHPHRRTNILFPDASVGRRNEEMVPTQGLVLGS